MGEDENDDDAISEGLNEDFAREDADPNKSDMGSPKRE